MSSSRQAAAAAFGRRLAEDVRIAGGHFAFSTLGGSAWIPRIGRRLLFTAAGVTCGSAPGLRFRFAGSPRNLTVGHAVYMNQGVFIEAIAPVVIGAGCALGMDVLIITSHHALDAAGSWTPEAEGRPVTLGERVWVGARAVILPGATVESDVVIAAGAVVRGHCRSHGVYGGVPARRIRDLDAPRSTHTPPSRPSD